MKINILDNKLYYICSRIVNRYSYRYTRMTYNDFLLFYLLLLISLHFTYFFYMLNFILNSIIIRDGIRDGIRDIHNTSYIINYSTSIYIDTITYNSIELSRILFNTTN